MIARTDLVKDLGDLRFERCGIAMLSGHPGMFDQMPEFLDAVQLRAVGWQKVEGHSLAAQDLQVGLNGTCGMKGGVIEDDDQGFRDLLAQHPEEADEDERINRAPQGGADHLARREEGGDHVQPLAAHRRNGVLLPDGGPGAAVGMDLSEARFIEIGHRDLTVLRLPPQGANLLLCLGKFRLVALFFLWRQT